MRILVVFLAGVLVGLMSQVTVAQNQGIVGLNHVGLSVANIDESVAFYTQKMGFREAFRTKNDQGQTTLVFIQTNRNTFIELGQANAQRPAGMTHFGVHVENMTPAVSLFQQRGLTVTEPRLSAAVGSTQANITDPSGVRIELTEMPATSLQRKAMDSWRE